MDVQRPAAVAFRETVGAEDRVNVRRIVASSGFFSRPEIEVAVELVDDFIEKGPASGYHFIFAEREGKTIGYSCFGPIPCTTASFDLYWIAVEEGARHARLGSEILIRSEAAIKALGGTRVYVETSSRPQYEPTRRFYEGRGYRRETVLEDFYAPGDGKVMYVKVV
ncbi:MAG: GNAT family N-acetyltransferase [Spirochaetales bacterium]|nr:GNAT family N-acetyltransferase [Spirochaetales bacterium]